MNAINNLRHELRSASILKDALKRRYPSLADDAQALADMIEGETDLDKAIASCVAQIEQNETLAKAIAEQIRDRQDRKKRLEETASTIRSAILDAMEAAGWKKLTLPEATVSIASGSPSVVITDEQAAVAAGYGSMTPKVDKAAVRNALKDGATLTFATLSNGSPSLMLRRS